MFSRFLLIALQFQCVSFMTLALKRRPLPNADAPILGFILAAFTLNDGLFRHIELNISLYLSYQLQQNMKIRKKICLEKPLKILDEIYDQHEILKHEFVNYGTVCYFHTEIIVFASIN